MSQQDAVVMYRAANGALCETPEQRDIENLLTEARKCINADADASREWEHWMRVVIGYGWRLVPPGGVNGLVTGCRRQSG